MLQSTANSGRHLKLAEIQYWLTMITRVAIEFLDSWPFLIRSMFQVYFEANSRNNTTEVLFPVDSEHRQKDTEYRATMVAYFMVAITLGNVFNTGIARRYWKGPYLLPLM